MAGMKPARLMVLSSRSLQLLSGIDHAQTDSKTRKSSKIGNPEFGLDMGNMMANCLWLAPTVAAASLVGADSRTTAVISYWDAGLVILD